MNVKTANRAFPLFVLLFDVVLVGWAIVQGYQDDSPQYFFKEGRLITFLSSFHLIAIGLLCWLIYESKRYEENGGLWSSPVLIWLLMALGFLFLAFDETMRIHEGIDFSLHNLIGIKETALTDRLDDVLILLYALIGLFAIYLYRAQLSIYYPLIRGYFIAAFMVLLLTVILDVLTNRHDIIHDIGWHQFLSVLEEVMKIVAEFLFLAAAYRCWKFS